MKRHILYGLGLFLIFSINALCSYLYFHNEEKGVAESDVATFLFQSTESSNLKNNQEAIILSLLDYDLEKDFEKAIYARSLITQMVEEHLRGFVENVLGSQKFRHAKNSSQRFYAREAFFNIGEFFPETFFEYYPLLIRDWNVRGYAFEAFFRSLMEKDPVMAYEMLRDDRIKGFFMRDICQTHRGDAIHTKECMFGYTEPEEDFIRNHFMPAFDLKRLYLRRLAIERIGLTDLSILRKEMDNTTNVHDRISVLESIGKSLTLENYEQNILVLKNAFSFRDREYILSCFMKQLSSETNDWRTLWQVANNIGFRYLSTEATDRLFYLAAAEGPAMAIDLVTQAYSGKNQIEALSSVLWQIAEMVPSEKMISIYDSLPEGKNKEVIRDKVLHKYSIEHPYEMIEWMKENDDWYYVLEVTGTLLKQNADEGKQFALEMVRKGDSDIMHKVVLGFIMNEEFMVHGNVQLSESFINELDEKERIAYSITLYGTWIDSDAANAMNSLLNLQSLTDHKAEIIIGFFSTFVANIEYPLNQKRAIQVFSALKGEDTSMIKSVADAYVNRAVKADVEAVLRGMDQENPVFDIFFEAWENKQAGNN